MILDCRSLSLDIQMRRYPPDHFNRPHAVSDGHNRIAIHALAGRPLAPLAVHRAGRVDEDAVQIKKNG